ncbi:hypothetical protein AB0G02_03220 [Actinosynnema sp. NPDC023658]|uniref:hypothetical protein n=1 Tax=Actinosynnema sp. NPDC023658 TaxID=3155465 RepID=UPI0033C80CF0
MTQPPFDPYRPNPDQPHPGRPYPAQPYPAQPYTAQPYPAQPYTAQPYPAQPYGPSTPGQPYAAQPYPGHPHGNGMRGIDQFTTARHRPTAVVAAFALWLLTALSWPVGSLVRTLAEDEPLGAFGSVMGLFASSCLGIAAVWGAVLLLRGSYQARLGLCGGALVIGILALAAAIIAARDGDVEPLSWVVIVLRLVLPAAAAVCGFLPGTRQYFSGSAG